jgi:beta-lysine 5,6-aminomutase beta subunit
MSDTPTLVRPYGDTTGDGMVQVSFTLPLPHDKRAEGAALQLARKMGMEPALLVHAKAMGPDFTFFVVYGSVSHLVDLREVTVVEREYPLLTAKEVNLSIKRSLRRKLVVVGACIGTDAHTVGIDAILNYKGYAGDKGLESYKWFEAYNMGAQVENDQLMARAKALKADAVLVSQVITQRNCHKENGQALVDAIKKEGWRNDVILLFGGPRIDHKLALELGFDAGFGPGTKPGDVASFLVEKMCGEERVKGTEVPAAVTR